MAVYAYFYLITLIYNNFILVVNRKWHWPVLRRVHKEATTNKINYLVIIRYSHGFVVKI